MPYNPKIHNRQSIRLKGYDYSKPGAYFLTICAQNHQHLFGEVVGNEMILNDAGKMIEKWYHELENKYPNSKSREYMVMPNHFHCIIEIVDGDAAAVHDAHTVQRDAHAGTSLRGRPDNVVRGNPDNVVRGNPDNVVRGNPDNVENSETANQPQYGPNNQKYNASIFDMMDWFKTMTTNEYIRGVKTKNWQRFNKRVWQLRYWDHIIRGENDYIRIANYIKNNPQKWAEDKFNN